jgi:tetratricopeptide (TPR) repeat protein
MALVFGGLLFIMACKHFHWKFLNIDVGLIFVGGFAIVGFGSACMADVQIARTRRLREAGRYAEVERLLRSGLRLHQLFGPVSNQYVEDLIQLAQACRIQEKYEEAGAYAHQAECVLGEIDKLDEAKAEPQSKEAERMQAICAVLSKLNGPLRAKALYEQAATKFFTGDFREAERLGREQLKHLEAGIAEVATSQRPAIIASDENILTKDFALAAAQNMNNPDIAALGNLHEAVKGCQLLERILKVSGKEDEAASIRSRKIRFCNQAIEILDKKSANQSRPEPQNQLVKAGMLMLKEQYKEAIAIISSALDTNMDSALRHALLLTRGECFNRMGQLSSAEEDTTEALKLIPASGTALYNRAEIYAKQKKHEQAAQDRLKALELGCRVDLLLSDADLTTKIGVAKSNRC